MDFRKVVVYVALVGGAGAWSLKQMVAVVEQPKYAVPPAPVKAVVEPANYTLATAKSPFGLKP